MRDTFVTTLRWSIPDFSVKIAELGEHRSIKSNNVEIGSRVVSVYLYPKGFTFYPDSVGVFLDALPYTEPILVKFFR